MTQYGDHNALWRSTNTANFAARDERIRCPSYGVMRKLAGLQQDVFAGYWRDVLGTLLARLPGVSYYVQHHFFVGSLGEPQVPLSCRRLQCRWRQNIPSATASTYSPVL